MTPAADIATWEARGWIGTPFMRRQALRGVGVSCHALIFAAGWKAEVLPMGQDEFDERFGDYGHIPNGHRFREMLESYFVEVDHLAEPLAEADVVWISYTTPDVFARKRLRPFGTHLGLITLDRGDPYMIHADGVVGVVEEGYRGAWPARTVGRFRFPGLA
jgi:hypothetical protein